MKKNMVYSLLLGILLGLISYYIGLNKMAMYTSTTKTIVNREDLLRQIFVVTDFKIYPYMDAKDNTILMLPILFYLGGIFLGVFSFLSKKKNYFQFVVSRCDNRGQLRKIVVGPGNKMSILYTVSYIITLFLLSYRENVDFISSDSKINVILLFLFLITTLFLLQVFIEIGYIIYLKKDNVVTFLSMVGLFDKVHIIV